MKFNSNTPQPLSIFEAHNALHAKAMQIVAQRGSGAALRLIITHYPANPQGQGHATAMVGTTLWYGLGHELENLLLMVDMAPSEEQLLANLAAALEVENPFAPFSWATAVIEDFPTSLHQQVLVKLAERQVRDLEPETLERVLSGTALPLACLRAANELVAGGLSIAALYRITGVLPSRQCFQCSGQGTVGYGEGTEDCYNCGGVGVVEAQLASVAQ